jgi:hypothetical protein
MALVDILVFNASLTGLAEKGRMAASWSRGELPVPGDGRRARVEMLRNSMLPMTGLVVLKLFCTWAHASADIERAVRRGKHSIVTNKRRNCSGRMGGPRSSPCPKTARRMRRLRGTRSERNARGGLQPEVLLVDVDLQENVGRPGL